MRNIHIRQLWTACCSLLFAGTAVADDWPQWLGTQRDSVWRETDIVRSFPAAGLPVKWRVKVAGGYAGPAVAAGKVFVTDYHTTGDKSPAPGKRNVLQGTERVLCLSADSGKVLWKHEYECAYRISYPAGPRTTPTVDGDHVYTLGAEGDLFCLHVNDGSVVWSHNLKQDYRMETPIWGFCGHPLVDGNKLICLVGGQGSVAVAFNKQTGKELWRSLSAREPGYCPPTIIQAGGKRQLLIWHAQSINSLDPENGTPFWSIPLEPDYGMSIVTPRKLGDYLFVGAIVNKAFLLQLGRDKPSAKIVWRTKKDLGIGPVHTTPFLEDGHMYGVDRQGELRCVKLSSGEHLWSTYAAMPGNRRANSGTAFIVKNGDRFFLASETGHLILARMTPSGYDEISRTKLLDPTTDGFGRRVVWSHPAFANKCVYWRNDKELVCVSLAAAEQ